MSGKTKGKGARPYRSGFCGAGNPPESHARCPGSYRGEACSCEHHTAPSPEAVSEVVQETEATSYDGPAWVDYDMPEDAYHAHEGSVSASELKRVLDCPARYQHERQVPRQPRTVFDVGHAAHAKVLGVGAPVTVIEVDHKRGNAWAIPAAEAREAGHTPLTRPEADATDAMAEAILKHPLARLCLTGGDSEVSAFWHDPTHDVTRRARFDHLSGQVIGDLKTAASVTPRRLPRVVEDLGYDVSAAQYLDVARGAGLDVDSFVLVWVEKSPPHLVVVTDLAPDWLDVGRAKCARALAAWRECTDTGVWPGYLPGDAYLTLTRPRWAPDEGDPTS